MRVASHLGGALVLPTVRVGYSPHHLGFTGTLSLRASTLESVCEDYCRHLAKDGFERIVMFSGHIGNHPVMRDFEVRLTAALAPLTVIVFSETEAILNAWRRAADSVASLGANVGGHADIAETSVMLALHPQKVRTDRFARGYIGKVDQQLLDRAFQEGIGAVSANGILGDPAGALERLGEACLEAVTSLIADYARTCGA